MITDEFARVELLLEILRLHGGNGRRLITNDEDIGIAEQAVFWIPRGKFAIRIALLTPTEQSTLTLRPFIEACCFQSTLENGDNSARVLFVELENLCTG